MGTLSRSGLFINENKVCSTRKISNGEYDILYEKEVDSKTLRGALVYSKDLFSPHYLIGKGDYSKYYSKCSFINYYQKATWDYRAVLVLEDLDEKTSLATVKLDSKTVYFSTRDLKLRATLRPPMKELEHRSISPIEFAKVIEKNLLEFRKKSMSRMGGTEEQKLKEFNQDWYKEKEKELFNISTLDWMDEDGEQKLKKRLIQNFGETRLLRHFDFKNMHLSLKFSDDRASVDPIKLYFYYRGIGRMRITIVKPGGKLKYYFNFSGERSFENWEERTTPIKLDIL